MTSFNPPSVSKYQTAILTEMGITTWSLLSPRIRDAEPDEANSCNVEVSTPDVSEARNSSNAKNNSLDKLEECKVNAETLIKTDSVLTTFTQNETSSLIFNDVLTALNLTANKLLYIEPGKELKYQGYPMLWQEGDQISLNSNVLSSPPLNTLIATPSLKKKLWDLMLDSNEQY